MRIRFNFAFLFICIFLFSINSEAQYQTSISKQSAVLLPPDYDPSKTYPAVVFMPYTGGSATDFFKKYVKETKSTSGTYTEQFADMLDIYNTERGTNRSFILILPDGAGSTRDHSWKGFSACIQRYEKRVRKDLKTFIPKYNIDSTQVIIAGVSLGGDLSWALSMRNPDLFKGAVVMGSRCSYPTDGVLPTLAAKNYSFYMMMGMNEARDRLSGIAYARRALDTAHIDHIYKEMPFLAHNRAPLWMVFDAIDYTLYDDNKNNNDQELEETALLQLVRDYRGHFEEKRFELQQDVALLAKGDGLMMPQTTKITEYQTVRIEHVEGAKVKISFPNRDLPSLTAFVLENRVNGELENIKIKIPEQVIDGYKYRGIALDISDPQEHGRFNLEPYNNYFSLDFERHPTRNKHQVTTYSSFVLLMAP